MDYEVVVIGAGVVGLAVAAELSKSYSLVVLEKNRTFGQETSSHNSEVVHSGIYYPKNSLKAKLCIEGRRLLYEFCEKNEVDYRQTGKLIVATNQTEALKLDAIVRNALDNGVEDVHLLPADELRQKEPYIKAVKAAFFGQSGIVSASDFMKKLETEAINNAADFAYASKVTGIRKIKGGYALKVSDYQGDFEFTSKAVINCAGLWADEIALISGTFQPDYTQFFWKGQYFSVGNGKHKLLKHLIYPVPGDKAGLGIHTVTDTGGSLKLGPDAVIMSLKSVDYKVDIARKEIFYASAKRFLPFLDINDLSPDQAGIRPKLTADRNIFRDFIIKEETQKGFAAFVNLLGIESPGLTASLAIAKYVKSLIKI